MRCVPTVIIGAGQAGLAMSHCLGRHHLDHVVLERGRIGERWRSERWDSLRLLTPNWMSRLPGWFYRGDDPDGFMTAGDFAAYLASYAQASRAPIETGTEVLSVSSASPGYLVETTSGVWRTRAVVIASGDCDVPNIPAAGRQLPEWIHQLTPSQFRNASQLPDGGVVVVGASATGVQLADEMRRSGREVTISVGRHTRLPRRYRGRDIWWWLEAAGVLDETTAEVSDLQRARRLPSFQLVGGPDGRTIDLGTLRDVGVCIRGRVTGVDGSTLRFCDDLEETTTASHAALERLLSRIDVVADAIGAPAEAGPVRSFDLGPAPTMCDLRAEGIGTVLWSTGFRRNYAWLKVPVFDAAGEIRHEGGITPSPGLYVLGLRFLRRRRSHFIDGVGRDAEELAEHLRLHLAATLPDKDAA